MASPTNQEALDAVISEVASLATDKLLWEDSRYLEFTDEAPTASKVVSLIGYLAMPEMEEWAGTAEVHGLLAVAQNLEAKSYTKRIPFDIKDLLSDNQGEIARTIAAFFAANSTDKLKLATEILVAGESTLGFDGQNFFGANHEAVNGGTQSNVVASAFARASWEAIVEQGRKITDIRGKPLNINYDTAMGGAAHIPVAKDIFDGNVRTQGVTAASVVDSGTIVAAASIDNRNQGMGKFIYNPYMNGNTDVIVWDSTKVTKPIVMRVLSDMTPKNSMDQPGPKDTTEEVVAVDFHALIALFDWRTCGILAP